MGYIDDLQDTDFYKQNLRKSEANLAAILENATENIWAINTAGEVLYANKIFIQGFLQAFGVTIKKGTKLGDHIPETMASKWKKRSKKVLSGESMYFEEKMIAGEKEFFLEVTANPIFIGEKIEGASFYAKNITERVKNARALQKSEQRFRQIAELSQTVIWEIAKDGSYTYVSPMAEKVWGYKPDELVNKKKFYDLHPEEQREGYIRETMEIVKEKKTFHDFINPVKKKNGEIIWVKTNGMPIKDNLGFLLGYRGSDEDITDTLKAEKALIDAKEKAEESDRLKTAFLQNMSHEIRTPMNGILGFLELLKEPGLDEEGKNQYIELVTQSGQRLLNTINDIIEISKIEAGQSEKWISPTNIHEVTHYLYNFFKPETDKKGLLFSLNERIPREKSIIRTDKHKLTGILTNLLTNAIKFTKKGSIELGNYLEKDYIIFYVRDTGTGIPPDRKKVIFDRFVQANLKLNRGHEGSGLGLSIVKAYLELLEGKVEIESEEGIGSTFRIFIPHQPMKEKNSQDKEEHNNLPKTQTKVKILVAEDDPMSYRYLETILSKEGFSIIHTLTGEDTVEKVKTIPDISLILMDLKMPKMTGLEATRKIKSFNPEIPVIAQTAYAFSDDKERALEAGCDDYISKPINKNKLLEIITHFLNNQRN